MTLAKKIDKWYQAGEHEETVKAILNLTEGEITDVLTEDLAVAYNNLGQYQKAIQALKNMDCQNRSYPHWHYCMGYALYYAAMDSPTREKQHSLLQGAHDSFSHALKLKPGKELEKECREFLQWIKDDLNSTGFSPQASEQEGAFMCSILLSAAWFDKEKFMQDFYIDWSLHAIPADAANQNGDIAQDASALAASSSLVFSADNIMAAITLVPSPIPMEEAKKAAACNYLWPNAWKAAQKHKAHLLVTVLDTNTSLMSRGLLLVKIVSTCCLQLPAIGVFTGGSVYQLGLYRNLASVIKQSQLPVFNWIWFGLYRTGQGISGYTYGMELFGKDEIEILDTNMEPGRLRNFLIRLACCAIEEYAVFQNGDTVSLPGGETFSVARSKGAALPGMTLKIISSSDAP